MNSVTLKPVIEKLNGNPSKNVENLKAAFTNGKNIKSSATLETPVTAPTVSIPELKLNGFVGFDSLPYQLVRKCHSNG